MRKRNIAAPELSTRARGNHVTARHSPRHLCRFAARRDHLGAQLLAHRRREDERTHIRASDLEGLTSVLPSQTAIAESAFKHGLNRESIGHAYRHRIIAHPLDSKRPDHYLVIGPDLAGNLIELALSVEAGETVRVFHAMPIRRQHIRMLRRSPGRS